ncbi:MAG TPA: ATP-dependent endonuclease [Leeuwenhoekiella sp.]|uniref:ATP-dependent DNA helicase n=1 Tax=Leeuwenhoekiella TaxID=283735 RepID=UPI000E8A3C01|nr:MULTISPECIES: AAA family ATPase [Leeuwenhoekiella]UBZ10039.1 AAA family ATPase [Leeuwenhoekiella palythoae]HAX15476.1 ATP-dependent endonuclease [Leeuwenhoekiella sp.]HBO29317.1 ATP-dependent endonuclease [Leeuwenhoekiella sp.]HCQ75863.1 ATP-dependent endonuclease [Leeuwenhoekiella sp.]|tara:strand:- start:144 stop:1577 length:1434 start_codon:yes stop_codon:yes gene_type:complete
MELDQHAFYKLLLKDFPFTPTQKQDILLQQLSDFIFEPKNNSIYVLKGFAGTGKTTVIGTIVKNLWKIKMSSVQLAPTGRAAKVISNYSDKPAHTIHRKIYYPKKERGGGVSFTLQRNKHRNTIFIVDEASMISDNAAESKLFENGSLLDDLMSYVYSGHKCKLLLIGDQAQLPPVKMDLSPALDARNLQMQFDKTVKSIELDEVMRQAETSGILKNATRIREFLNDELYEDFKFDLSGQDDVIRLIDGHEIMDALGDSYREYGNEGTAIIVRSNKRANLYNQQIRSRILFKEEEVSAGDYFMVVKNNYFWLDTKSEAGFIANGDIIEILEIFSIKELYGFRFAEVKIQMTDYPNLAPFETVLLLDTLTSETPSLSYEEGNTLYQEVMKDYADETSKYKKFMKVKNNKFFNALQVKFSYAITCHKSQGGQWETIMVEQPYLPNGMDKDYLRWLYTAVTRARKKLYLIGFKDDMFIEN